MVLRKYPYALLYLLFASLFFELSYAMANIKVVDINITGTFYRANLDISAKIHGDGTYLNPQDEFLEKITFQNYTENYTRTFPVGRLYSGQNIMKRDDLISTVQPFFRDETILFLRLKRKISNKYYFSIKVLKNLSKGFSEPQFTELDFKLVVHEDMSLQLYYLKSLSEVYCVDRMDFSMRNLPVKLEQVKFVCGAKVQHSMRL